VGMFDSLYVGCPKCGGSIEFQSKAGDCVLAEYTLADCPPEVAGDLIGQFSTCRCGHTVTLRGAVVLIPEHYG
jgi:hypothetical protein